MRRADRLFQLIQILRRSRRPVTAEKLAGALEVSKRTVYRDVADLVGRRVPILGEAGLGYQLAPGFDMPPLMLTPDEIEALVLGAQWVAGLPDPRLADAARDAVAKISAVLPQPLRTVAAEPGVAAKPAGDPPPSPVEMRALRAAIRQGLKLRLRYRAEAGAVTERTVWPVVLGYAETHALLIAWCETRGAFRHFRTDRILAAEVSRDRYGARRGELRRRWELWREAERDGRAAR